ncbi:MAG: hypothetical protein EYC70_07275 [Planctomycetota bacterium]|nr:MAG: hypothetical protein EYC70_07275 [Planctomycetota bacterium]
MDDRNLIAVAEQAAAPSRVLRGAREGATVKADDGRVFLGCRMEFADPGLDTDAISNGMAAGQAQGMRRVARVGLYSPAGEGLPRIPRATLLRLRELAAPGLVVILSGGNGRYVEKRLEDLLAEAGVGR